MHQMQFIQSLLSFYLLVIICLSYVWIMALVDILKNEFTGSNKIIWLLVVAFLGPVGLILYFTIGKKQQIGTKPELKYNTVNSTAGKSVTDQYKSVPSSITDDEVKPGGKQFKPLFVLLRDSEQEKGQSESKAAAPRFTTEEEYIQWKEKLTKEEYIHWEGKWTEGNEKKDT